jgi:hypothetical protein
MLTGLTIGLVVLVVLVAFMLLFVVDFGVALMKQEFSEWRRRRNIRNPRRQAPTDRGPGS